MREHRNEKLARYMKIYMAINSTLFILNKSFIHFMFSDVDLDPILICKNKLTMTPALLANQCIKVCADAGSSDWLGLESRAEVGLLVWINIFTTQDKNQEFGINSFLPVSHCE